MEQLTVKNFLVIKEAQLDVKRFNVIIGSQGTGKSVLAKLLYFFQRIGLTLRNTICDVDNSDINVFIKNIKKEFISIFPKYAWENDKFNLFYNLGNEVYIQFNNADELTIILSKKIISSYNETQSNFKSFKVKMDKRLEPDDLSGLPKGIRYRRYIKNLIEKTDAQVLMHSPNFIPASRAFFSLFYENLFTILSSTNNLDPFLVNFGQYYESYRSYYNARQEKIGEKFPIEYCRFILNGDIVESDKKCFIVNKDTKIELINASSGQQEALPMLQTLAVLNMFGDEGNITFIEEPEAHLFPMSQAYVMKLLAYLYGRERNFFLTTHSPYILSELNNYLYSNDLLKRGLLSSDDFNKILPNTSPIDIDEISAYKMEDGILTPIIDYDYSMIDTNELDKASGHASDIYNQLLEFEPIQTQS